MSLQTQVPADFLTFDGLQDVTYRSRANEDGDFDDMTSGDTFLALPTRGENELETDIGNVAAGRRSQVWWCRASDIEDRFDTHAKPRDRLVADNGTWEVWRVENRCLNTMYRLVCLEVVHP